MFFYVGWLQHRLYCSVTYSNLLLIYFTKVFEPQSESFIQYGQNGFSFVTYVSFIFILRRQYHVIIAIKPPPNLLSFGPALTWVNNTTTWCVRLTICREKIVYMFYRSSQIRVSLTGTQNTKENVEHSNSIYNLTKVWRSDIVLIDFKYTNCWRLNFDDKIATEQSLKLGMC